MNEPVMILILSTLDDDHVDAVSTALHAARADYAWFDSGQFPANASVRVTYDRGGMTGRLLRACDNEIDLSAVTAVWNRHLATSVPDAVVGDEEHRRWTSQVAESFLASLWDTLDCEWIPGPPAAWRGAMEKTNQLAVAARLGFSIPRTCVTNSPDAFLEFYEACDGHVISKVTSGRRVQRGGERCTAYTHVVTRRDAANHAAIRLAPVIFQEEIDKQSELRITIVGTQIFAVDIQSQSTHAGRHDWRHADLHRLPHVRCTLPVPVEERCHRLMRALGLCFGGIDMIVTPSGEYVFLEVNPLADWLWIEELTRAPITAAVADFLIQAATMPAKGVLYDTVV
jgi:hypothetical protein